MSVRLSIRCATPTPAAGRLRRDGAAPRAAYGARMRWLAVVLAVGCLGRGAALDAQPLLSRADDLAVIYPALMALSTGDLHAIEALPAHLFLAPAATPDANDPALVRRWTLALPAALARLAPPAQAAALAALDRRFLALAESTPGVDARARLALAFLPAPQARAALAAAADHAFDLGDLRRYLALATRLDALGDARVAVARRLLGSGAEVEPTLRLGAPGRPTPTAATPGTRPAGDSVTFAIAPGWLLACDPWGGVLWQYRLEHRATVVPGNGGALIQDSAGVRLLDEAGAAFPLPPPPPGARLLAVSGGAAWFATDGTIYRLDLADRHVRAVDLPEPPLAPPLVRGPASLWLTAHDLLLVAEGRISARLAHGLAAGPGWRLGSDGAQPLLVDSDGRAYHLQPLDDQLAAATPVERLRLLLQAARPGEALALWRASPGLDQDPAARALALRALLSDRAAVAADPAAALALAGDAQDQATVLMAAGAGRDARLGAQLQRLCDQHPDVLIEAGDPAQGEWVLAGRAWAARGDGLAAWRRKPAQRQALSAAVPGTAPGPARRRPDGGWDYLGWRYQSEATPSTSEVTCRDAAGDLRWRRRWSAPDALSAPGRALAFRDGYVVLAEGAARLTVLDAATGESWAALRPSSEILPQQVILLGRERVAELGPLGLDTTLRLIDRDGTTAIPLPGSARWMVPWGDGVLVVLGDGRAMAYPAVAAVTLPDELVRGGAPAVTGDGLVRDGRRWGWR